MRKRTTIFCSFLLTALLLGGCGCGRVNEQTPPSSATQKTSTPESGNSAVESTQGASVDTGKASSMISENKAKEIALSHADLVEEEVTFSKFELDRKSKSTYYDIEFYTEDRLEYDYEIDAYSGEIVSYEWDDDELFLE